MVITSNCLLIFISTDRTKLGIVVTGFREALIAYRLHHDKIESVNVFFRIASSAIAQNNSKILSVRERLRH